MTIDFIEAEWIPKPRRDPCIALFGTCGGSTWRDVFISEYEAEGITYYNPVVENWTPECAAEEARHLATDDIILFPVTDETAGFGSLAEIGFAVAQILTSSRMRSGIFYVAEKCDNVDSNKVRALVRAHLSKVDHHRIRIVNNLEQMLDTSLEVFDLAAGR